MKLIFFAVVHSRKKLRQLKRTRLGNYRYLNLVDKVVTVQSILYLRNCEFLIPDLSIKWLINY